MIITAADFTFEKYQAGDYGEHVIICGDCRNVLPKIEPEYVIVTDPIWPNTKYTFGVDDPQKLAMEGFRLSKAKALVVHLGFDTDPRFLMCVPDRYKFIRHINLRYARPNYKGRLLGGHDCAYAFGEVPKSRLGLRVIGGEVCAKNSLGRETDHPCPRKIEHVKWLVVNLSDPGELVVDPFAGSGTTMAACFELGRKSISIELNWDYCVMAEKRIVQECLKV